MCFRSISCLKYTNQMIWSKFLLSIPVMGDQYFQLMVMAKHVNITSSLPNSHSKSQKHEPRNLNFMVLYLAKTQSFDSNNIIDIF